MPGKTWLGRKDGEIDDYVLSWFLFGKLWKTPAAAKGGMAPQGFSGGRSAEIMVIQSFFRAAQKIVPCSEIILYTL
jgi:hypothetical protein